MKAAVERLIAKIGTPVDVVGVDSGDSGGRSIPSRSAQGTVDMIIEQRGMGTTVTDSSGQEYDADLELRAVPDDTDPEIHGGAESGQDPTILDHPSVGELRVMRAFTDDAGVLVIAAVEN